MKAKFLFIIIFLFLATAQVAFAHQPVLVFLQKGNTQIKNPEISQAFYDELAGAPKDYFIDSDKNFTLYINLLVPASTNPKGKYSAKIFSIENDKEREIAFVDGVSAEWKEYYEEFGRDWYYKGPEFEKHVLAGKYKIEVFSGDNSSAGSGQAGKYVLAVGKTESFDIKSLLNIFWQLPMLKLTFFKTSVLQFFLTPFGIGLIAFLGVIIIFIFLINFIVDLIKNLIKHNQAKTLLLTSAGMAMKAEITKLLQKPAYDITVAFITTASKSEENADYMRKDLIIMRDEMGFNVEEIDIEGKKEGELMQTLKLKDIIFVEGGNTFYLLKAMRKCNFERIIRKLLKKGIVYVGASAGSMVAGPTIETANWKTTDKNLVGLKNLKGLNLVPFNIFVHYKPEHAELVQKQIQKTKYPLKIITDEQAILVQGKEVAFIGQGEMVEFKKKFNWAIYVLVLETALAVFIFSFLAYTYLLK